MLNPKHVSRFALASGRAKIISILSDNRTFHSSRCYITFVDLYISEKNLHYQNQLSNLFLAYEKKAIAAVKFILKTAWSLGDFAGTMNSDSPLSS
jgi:hypothetical protein